MNLDFALILVVLTLFSGVVWLIDSLAFRQRRLDRAVRLDKGPAREPVLVGSRSRTDRP